jgi:hypothetical protein
MRATSLIITAAMVTFAAAGCADNAIVTTEDTGARAPAPSAAPSGPPPSNAHLVNAFHYGAPVDGFTRYFFTTPSGRWQCGIVPRVQAGCEPASGTLSVTGAPESVPDAAGEPTAPTAVVIERDGDARFIASEAPQFGVDPGPANVLPFNRILAVAGFRCNVQEAVGISCVSELSGRGFTFSDDGFTPQYTDVPAGAP